MTEPRAGNFALGVVGGDIFTVNYVGRSDIDVCAELKSKPVGVTHRRFKFSYANSAKEAYEKECVNYHDFSPPENKIHPDRPKGTSLTCPVCGN